jgi:hypothetical protein
VNELTYLFWLRQWSDRHCVFYICPTSRVIRETCFGALGKYVSLYVVGRDGVARDTARCEFDAERFDKGIDARPCHVGNSDTA